MNRLAELTELDELKNKSGSYVLILNVPATSLKIGSLGLIDFVCSYAYVGSAKSGLLNRVKRHFGQDKKFHWHIDYLLARSEITAVYWSQELNEQEIADFVSSRFGSVPGFGASDSRLDSHLFQVDSSIDLILKSFKP
ncbi:MAG: GIY-YIG nuclease family protein [Candidatus Altiarchaeota archaeon]|nr:GIY-YIG nuclease family protein [Candidatus Altiarchaeota archaeon]